MPSDIPAVKKGDILTADHVNRLRDAAGVRDIGGAYSGGKGVGFHRRQVFPDPLWFSFQAGDDDVPAFGIGVIEGYVTVENRMYPVFKKKGEQENPVYVINDQHEVVSGGYGSCSLATAAPTEVLCDGTISADDAIGVKADTFTVEATDSGACGIAVSETTDDKAFVVLAPEGGGDSFEIRRFILTEDMELGATAEAQQLTWQDMPDVTPGPGEKTKSLCYGGEVFLVFDPLGEFYGYACYSWGLAYRSADSPYLLGDELLVNPGFESSFDSWVETEGDGDIATTTVAGEFHAGTAAKLTAGASADTKIAQTVTVEAATKYHLSIWTRGDGLSDGQYGVYDVTNDGDVKTRTATGVTSETYASVVCEFTTPAGCTSVRVDLWAPATEGGIAYFDDISLLSMTPLWEIMRETCDTFTGGPAAGCVDPCVEV